MAQSFQPTAFEVTAFEALVIFAIISGGGSQAAALPTTARQNAAAISGSGGHVARGVKNAHSVAIPGSGNQRGSGFKSAIGTTAGPQGFQPTAFQLNAFQAGSGYSSTQGRIAGGGNHRTSGFKPTSNFGRISDSGYLLSAGQKNAFGAGRITGSGGHAAVGKQHGQPGIVSGGGSHRASGIRNLEFGLQSGSGQHSASGYKGTAGFGVQRAEGRLTVRGRRGETIPISVNIHVGPLITFRVHVSPEGARSMEDYLAIGSTNVVRATKMVNQLTGAAIIDADVTGTLLDKDGNPVTDAINFPILRVGSEYRGTISSIVNLVPAPYTVRVTASNADGVRSTDKPVLARRS